MRGQDEGTGKEEGRVWAGSRGGGMRRRGEGKDFLRSREVGGGRKGRCKEGAG